MIICGAQAQSAATEQSGNSEIAAAQCFDCRRPYGNEHGFPDLIIPLSAWAQISPTGDENGLLCPSCICKRLHDACITCEGAFMSGPIEAVSRPTMYALRRVENLERRVERLDRWGERYAPTTDREE